MGLNQDKAVVQLALYKARGKLFNWLIRLWTRSQYSHCELVMPDGRWLSASAMDGGVREKRIELNPKHWDLVALPWADVEQIEQVYQRHRGKGYDWLGILLAQFLPLGIDSKSRMFCSEFCAAGLGLTEAAPRFSPVLLSEVVQRMNRLPFEPPAPQPQDARNVADA